MCGRGMGKCVRGSGGAVRGDRVCLGSVYDLIIRAGVICILSILVAWLLIGWGEGGKGLMLGLGLLWEMPDLKISPSWVALSETQPKWRRPCAGGHLPAL